MANGAIANKKKDCSRKKKTKKVTLFLSPARKKVSYFFFLWSSFAASRVCAVWPCFGGWGPTCHRETKRRAAPCPTDIVGWQPIIHPVSQREDGRATRIADRRLAGSMVFVRVVVSLLWTCALCLFVVVA